MIARLLGGALAAAALLAPAAAQAAPPANDNFAARQTIASLPFNDSEATIGEATVEGSDPLLSCRTGLLEKGGNTLWYSYSTGGATEYVSLSTTGSDYDTVLAMYEGAPSRASVVTGGCNDDGNSTLTESRATGVRLKPNTTYAIEVASFSPSATAATLNLSVAPATRYEVTKAADTADGTCNADCSLREAITASNAAPGAVLVPAGTYNLTGAAGENANATGDLDVTRGMGIYGAGPGATTVNAEDLDRVLHVDPAEDSKFTLGVADIHLTNGTVTGDGGGVLLSTIFGFLDLEGTRLSASHASGGGGGVASSSRGRIRRSTLDLNQAGTVGGGISLPNNGGGVVFEVRDSTVQGNTSLSASSGGGGIHSLSALAMTNDTVAGNRANSSGGGVLSQGTTDINSSTIAGNTADFDDNDVGKGGGIFNSNTLRARNSVFANNTDNNSAPAPDCSASGGSITTSYSLLEATPGGCSFAGTGDVTGIDPGLAASPASNGGPTATIGILASTSAVVDAGDPAGCTDALGLPLAFDQRGSGFPRTIDGDSPARCDLGALEFANVAPECPSATASTSEDVPVTVTFACTDANGGPLTYSAATADHGTVTGTGASRTYTPDPEYSGDDTITFGVSDGENEDNATVAVTVTSVNDLPVARGDSRSTPFGRTLSVPAPGALANDSDVEGSALTAGLAAKPSNGTATVSANGAFSYKPNTGFSGVDTFTYRAGDGTAVSAPATVRITVGAGPTPKKPGADTTRPGLSKVRAARKRRALAFTLTEDARVVVKLYRTARGVRRGGRCVERGQGRRCKRRVLVKSYRLAAKKGPNVLGLGRLARRRYVVVSRATDAAGNRSKAVTRTLRLGRRK